MQFSPSDTLKPFVKSYTVITIDRDLTDEVFYPSGYVDLVINFQEGSATTVIDGRARRTPGVELLGHLTLPSRLTVTKGTSVLIARIYPNASSLFFPNPMSEFTNFATDAYGIFSRGINDFYYTLMDAGSLKEKVKALDRWLAERLTQNEKRYKKTMLIGQICSHICNTDGAFDSTVLTKTYGLSERYIQQLFLDHVGIAPSAFFSVYRFNKSLQLVLSSSLPLTSVAYDCGYYDQAHFIREFRKFTGITPFDARASLSANGEEFQQAVNIGF
jgi:AraC-like DNA-binding protein